MGRDFVVAQTFGIGGDRRQVLSEMPDTSAQILIGAAAQGVRNILVLAHNLIVIVAVFAIFRTVPSLASFSLLPACALWLVDAMAVSLVLGVFGARFRDIPGAAREQPL